MLVCALGLGARAVEAAPVSPASVPSVPLGVPQLAKVDGDATGVGLAWWAVKGAVQYQVLRAADPQGTASVRSTLPSGTLGYRDTLSANPAAWFQVVAIGADGARSASAWTLVNTPSIGGIDIGQTGALIRWTTVQPAPAGFEIWRSTDPQKPAARVGSVASGTTTFTDPKPLAGTSYYEVVALGGGARAASSWTATAAAPAGTGAMAGAPPLPGPLPSSSNPAQTATAGLAGAAAFGPPGTAGGANPAGPRASAPVLTAQLPTSTPASTNAAQPVQALSLPGTAPGAAVSGTPGAPTSAPPPVASSLLPPSPAITGLTVQSTSPVAHTAQWDCVNDEQLCGTTGTIPAAGSPPAPAFQYAVSSKAPGASQFDPVTPSQAIAGSIDCLNPACTQSARHLKAKFTAYIAPSTTIHVVRTDQRGKLRAASADFVYASPPPVQEPQNFTASEPQFGQVSLTWSAVPNATGYLVNEKGSTAPPAQVPAQSTTYQSATLFRNVSPGSHTYQVASAYGYPVPAVGLPEATVLVHPLPPPHPAPFLTKNNGAGSADAFGTHIGALNAAWANSSLSNINPIDPKATTLAQIANELGFAPKQVAFYANVTELGLGRSVGCQETINSDYGPSPLLMYIDCLASNHGVLPGAGAPDAANLTAAAASGASFAQVWIHWDQTMNAMTFMNFVPANGESTLPDPLTSGKWDGWKLVGAATLDGEGPKFLPHVCLPCHGGTYHADTGVVFTASFLPVDPSLVAFANPPGHDRASSEEAVRSINAMILDALPPQAVSDYIVGMYGGVAKNPGYLRYLQAKTPGAVAQSDYVPPGWTAQADLFRNVVKPDCIMCHLTTPTPAGVVFDSWDQFLANKATIRAAVCIGHSMPNAEVPYNHLWSGWGSSGGTSNSPVSTLLAALGYSGCP